MPDVRHLHRTLCYGINNYIFINDYTFFKNVINECLIIKRSESLIQTPNFSYIFFMSYINKLCFYYDYISTDNIRHK